MSANARTLQKQETRRALLDAARACFAEKGWAGTVVGDIARAAGVAHGTFYVHFADKDAIADALLAEINVGLAARVAPAIERAGDDLEGRVRAAARMFLAELARERAFVRWYAERLAGGVHVDALASGVNPQAQVLLDAWLERAGVGAERRSLLVHGLLALWLRVGLRTVLSTPPSTPPSTPDEAHPRAAEDVIVAATVGAVSALTERKRSNNRSSKASSMRRSS
ncbi:MAG: TetR/AcrR family transcriptional regulator [Deltaproteobacteria bacterium]|nr:TetR/AcrR family transcriptional regulator [Deltaproteobacteria bacterium]